MTKKACVIVGLLLLMTLIALVPLLLDRGTAPGISPGQREPVPHDVAVEGHPVCRAEAPEPTSKERREAAQPPPPRMILQGVVHDTLGNRVEGVRVTLTADLSEQRTEEMGRLGYQEVASGALTHEAVSDASGEFSVEGLLPIEYRGTIEKEGFLLLMPPKNPFRLRRDPGEERALEVLLCRAFRLHGTVLSADGVPIEGAEVLLDLDTARHVDGLGEAAGRLRVPVDPRGHYDTGPRMILAKYRTWEPAAWAPGHAVAYAGRIERDDAVGYDVEVDFALKLEARVEVFVEDPDGFPVEGAIVQGGALPGLASRTNPQGRALLDRLEPGERTVHVSKKGYFDEELSFDAGKERTVSVVLRRQGLPIEGSIVFDERLPQALRTVEKIHLVQRKPSGEVEGLVHGPVVLDQKERSFAFRPPPGWHYQVACRVGLREFGSEIVWYSGDETVRVDVHVLPEPPLVSGRVVDAQTGKPVGGATVVCRSSRRSAGGLSTWGRYRIFNGFHVPGMAGNATATTTDEEGHFLYLAPTRPVHGHGDERWGPIEGIATLYAVREGASVRTQGIPLSEPAVVEFDASTAVTDVVLEIMSPGSMEGRVVDAGGRPAVDEVVVAWDGLGTICATECDKEGRYRFEGLRPGRYLLVPVGRRSRSVPWGMGVGGGNRREGLPPPHEFFEFPVEVRPRETARYDMDLRRDALGAVEGTVSGVPGGGERVVIGMIINGEGRPYPPLGGRTIPKRGRFRFDNLLPGRYLVWIERDGIRLGETEVEIHASRQLQIDMPVEEATGSPRE